MVSWFVKQALVNLAADLGDTGARARRPRAMGPARAPARRQGRPHRRARHPARQAARSRATCSSTPGRSRASSPRACSRRSSAGARTRAGRPPTPAFTRPAAARRSICSSPAPTPACARGRRRRGAQFGFLVTHNESISIADYFTVRDDKGEAVYRPTCHYAYHPCDDAVLSLHELFGRAGKMQPKHHILGRSRDRRRHRRTRRAALRPRARTPIGTARSSPSRRRARSRRIRTRPACR